MVTGRDDGKAMLDALERGNLFVIPLDDKRQWYRYHHLFAEVLQTRLMEEQPLQIASLHQRASLWYEQNGMPSEAIRHALAAQDFERAAGLIELAWSAMDINLQSATWLGWAKALPDALISTRPVLSVGYA
jgi:LuxR family maltose regulon positive regulatory protein